MAAKALLSHFTGVVPSGASAMVHAEGVFLDFSGGGSRIIAFTFNVSAGDSIPTIHAALQAAMIAVGGANGITLAATDLYYPQLVKGS
jgi:hypothetical protein